MNQEELNALIKAQETTWEEEPEALPQAIHTPYPSPLTHQEESTHKHAKQLDAIFEDSQNKALEVFTQLENIHTKSKKATKTSQEVLNYAIRHLEIFEKLCVKFPNIKVFEHSFQETQDIIEKLISLQENTHQCNQHASTAIESMQFQETHRQKIARVMEAIKLLNQYVNKLFEDEINEEELPTQKPQTQEAQDFMQEDELQTLISSLKATP